MSENPRPLVVIDVGNTVLHWGYSLEPSEFLHQGRVPHHEALSLGASFAELSPRPQKIVVASVNPRPLASLSQGLEQNLGLNFMKLEVGHNWHPTAQVERPHEVGIDRLLNARALKDKCEGRGGIVIDHGTALTIDYVAPGGIYGGGTIVPGVALATRSLAEQTALIPQINFQAPPSVVGTNTEDCIRSGLYYGFVGLAEAIVRRIRYEKGEDLPVFVTGGDAAFLAEESSENWRHHPLLTLEGLLKVTSDVGIT